MATAQATLTELIRLYFPAAEVQTALCIAGSECPIAGAGWPGSCVGDEGDIDCGAGYFAARAYGPFGLLDACFDPDMNPQSPFTKAQWALVLDPNVNTWMASIVWSAYGWRAWSGCDTCNACTGRGLPVDYPRGPVENPPGIPAYTPPPPAYELPANQTTPPAGTTPPVQAAGAPWLLAVAAIGLGGLFYAASKKGARM